MNTSFKKDNKSGKFVSSLLDVNCKKCNILFHPRFKTTKYCSKKCESLNRIKDKRRDCIVCKTTFESRSKNTQFCSSKCYGLTMKKEKGVKQKKQIIKKIVNVFCITCNKNFDVYKSRELKVKFCSQICRGKFYKGEKSCHFKHDRDLLAKKQIRNDSAYKEWRKLVWLRDNFTCKIGNHDCSGRIEGHHIIPWAKSVGLRYEIKNGITLCRAHHPRMRAEETRLAPFFTELVTASK